jgi:hypothetical protein
MTETPTVREVTRILKARMAAAALRHADKVDVRTGTMLELAGLLKRESESDSDPSFVQIIMNPDHPRRIKTLTGPILLYAESENKDNRFAVDVRELFLSANVETRNAAWHYFMADDHSEVAVDLAPSTRAVLNSLRDKLVNLDQKVWQEAALQAHDTVELDLLSQLAGVRQSIREQYEDGLRYYISKLLEPDPRSFDVLGPVFLKPSEHREDLVKVLNTLVQDKQLVSASEGYVALLGILPRAGDLSFTRMVKEWVRRHGASESWRKEIRQWARASNRPLVRFYVALALLEIEGAEEKEEFEFIASLLTELLVDFEDEESKVSGKTYWALNCSLARHYLRHLETLSPGSLGEPLGIAAWWLSSRLALALCEFPDALAHLNDVAIQPQTNSTERAWRFANPTIESAATSTATHWPISPWSLAALNVLSFDANRSQAVLYQLQDRAAFERSLAKHAAFGCATPANKGPAGTYLFELDYSEYVGRLCSIVQDPDSEQLLQFNKNLYDQLGKVESFADKFASLSNCEEIDQYVIVNAARILSLQDQLPLEVVWAKLVDPEWRTKSFDKLSTTALEILFLSFARSLRRGGSKWLAGLPHIYAQAAEELVADTEKAKFLFALTVFSSIHTHTVSAIERLLRGRNRSQFIEHGRWWKNVLAQSSRTAPPWVSARIRALSAAISASQ